MTYIAKAAAVANGVDTAQGSTTLVDDTEIAVGAGEFNITVSETHLNPASNPITSGTMQIDTSLSVGTFLSNISIPAGAQYKVANANDISGAFEDWVFADITGKASGEMLVADDLLLVLSADGYLRGYYITVSGGGSGTPDTTPPVFATGYPTAATGSSDNQIKITVDLDEIGTVYYVVVDIGGSPSVAQVMAGDNDGSNPSVATEALIAGTIAVTQPGTPVTINVSELTMSSASPGETLNPGTYDVYFVAEDDESPANVQVAVTAVTDVDATGDSNDTVVTTVSDYYDVTIHPSSMIPADNPIQGGTVPINAAVTVGTLLGNLNQPANSQWKVFANANNPLSGTPPVDGVANFGSNPSKGTGDLLAENDLLFVLAEDEETLRGYRLIVEAAPAPTSYGASVTSVVGGTIRIAADSLVGASVVASGDTFVATIASGDTATFMIDVNDVVTVTVIEQAGSPEFDTLVVTPETGSVTPAITDTRNRWFTMPASNVEITASLVY